MCTQALVYKNPGTVCGWHAAMHVIRCWHAVTFLIPAAGWWWAGWHPATSSGSLSACATACAADGVRPSCAPAKCNLYAWALLGSSQSGGDAICRGGSARATAYDACLQQLLCRWRGMEVLRGSTVDNGCSGSGPQSLCFLGIRWQAQDGFVLGGRSLSCTHPLLLTLSPPIGMLTVGMDWTPSGRGGSVLQMELVLRGALHESFY